MSAAYSFRSQAHAIPHEGRWRQLDALTEDYETDDPGGVDDGENPDLYALAQELGLDPAVLGLELEDAEDDGFDGGRLDVHGRIHRR